MSRERQIFPTTDFETTVREREAFGWIYVKQTVRTRTRRAYHAGGGMNTGSGFIGGGTTTYDAHSWVDVEMYRDIGPGHAALVAEESRYFGAPSRIDPWATTGGRLIKWFKGWPIAFVPILLIASLQFIAPLENWFQRATADWSGDQLTIFALACLPLTFALLVACFLASAKLEQWWAGRFESANQESEKIRRVAMQRARAILGS